MIAEQFEKLWNFPHCLGVLDGKHVVLQAPHCSGSDYFNYKSTFSIVLFAVVDANYNFIFVGIECQGRILASGVFQNCALYQKLQREGLNLPKPQQLPERNKDIPYFFIGDEAFALTTSLMKVFPGNHEKVLAKEFTIIDSVELAELLKMFSALVQQFFEY